MPVHPPGRDRPVLVFDGDCGFCTASARWIQRRSDGRFDVAPWVTLDLDQLGLTTHAVTTAAWWVAPTGPPLGGHDAIAASLRASRSPWNWVGRFLALPGVRHLGRIVYPVIARNRHRLPGATDACAVTPPAPPD